MKTLKTILIAFTAIFLTSCMGEDGLDGYDGIDGQDGEALLGSIFEIQGDFTSANDYYLLFKFPNDFVIYDGDVVMVYILWDQTTNSNGEVLDVWRALPQTLIFNEGILQYNFDYTLDDVQIFMDGDIDFNILASGDTDNQIFRIAVLPAEILAEKSLDINSLNSMMNSEEVNSRNINRYQIPKVDTK